MDGTGTVVDATDDNGVLGGAMEKVIAAAVEIVVPAGGIVLREIETETVVAKVVPAAPPT